MALLTKKNFQQSVDTPKRFMDTQENIMNEAIKGKFDVKSTPLSRLHGIKTEVIYYEQIISDRQGNLANTASLNNFDTNLTKLRRISNFVILTDELEAEIEKESFTNMTFEGTAKLLPNTVIPNTGDYFIMKVFDSYSLFMINGVDPNAIEKDSGYSVTYKLFRQNVIPEYDAINEYVKEDYRFDYNHVGTDFRSVFKLEEYNFIQNSREIMYEITKIFTGVFYHKTLNTIMCQSGNLPQNLNNLITNEVISDYTNMIGNVILENRTIYDINLVAFMFKFDLTSSSESVHMLTQHIKPDKHYYMKSIFAAIENRDITRFVNQRQRLIYMNSNLYHHTNKLYGRFLVEHDGAAGGNDSLFINLFPPNFINKLTTYNSGLSLNSMPTYTNVNDLFIDIISTFINEKDDDHRRSIVLKLVNILMDKWFNRMYDEDFEDSYVIFYTYPIIIYVLKYMTREISTIHFK